MVSSKTAIARAAIKKAIAGGWIKGEEYLVKDEPITLESFIFEPGFGRALWGEELMPLRDIKTTRGQTISEEAWRFHQHIMLDFIQLAREELVYEYLEDTLLN